MVTYILFVARGIIVKKLLVGLLALLMVLTVGCSCQSDKGSVADFVRTAAPDDRYLRPDANATATPDAVIPDDAYDMSQSVPSFQVAGFSKMNVAAGKTDVRVALVNPEGNACYMSFVIELLSFDDAGNITNIFELYRTPKGEYVASGETLGSITLNKPLEVGEYDARLLTYFYDINTKALYPNSSSMQFTLVAKG